MEMKVEKVIMYNNIIKDIIDNAQDVNALVKFKLLGMLKQFEPTIANFEIIRNEKIKKYGTESDNGNFGIYAPNKDDFENDGDYENAVKEYEKAINDLNKEIDEVAKSDVEINFDKFKSADIMNAGIPANYLVAIYDLIEE